ncbi:hypothetical protein Tco_1043945 [Tanacetum coccineum]|uniref:Uncharacterized protein n=1 Tax=Tanacetum coccineum TaxID=301880 RepID=A0ABQ5GPP2_9ASTR
MHKEAVKQGRGNQGNQARGKAFMLGAKDARQVPNIVTDANSLLGIIAEFDFLVYLLAQLRYLKRLTVSKAIRFNVPRHALSCSTALTTTIGKTHSLRLNGGLPISESDVLSERTVSTRTSPRKWPCDYKDSPVPHLGASCCRESVISQKEEGSGDVGRERGYMDGRCVFYAVGSVGLREGGVGEVRILSFH